MSGDAVRAIQTVIDEMTAVAARDDDDNLPDWTSENRAEIDKWQTSLRAALAPVSVHEIHDSSLESLPSTKLSAGEK